MCWLGILDISRGESPTHPHAGDRFFRLYPIENLNELDGGTEVLGYLLTALFFPDGSEEHIDNTPREKVQRLMLDLYTRLRDNS